MLLISRLADLSSQQSIRHLVEHFQHHYTQLHVLINNAGASFPGRQETVDGLEMTFAGELIWHRSVLTNLLLDVLKASAPARIVNVSSNSHAAGYIQMDDLQSEHYRSMRVARASEAGPCAGSHYELARRPEGSGVTAEPVPASWLSWRRISGRGMQGLPFAFS